VGADLPEPERAILAHLQQAMHSAEDIDGPIREAEDLYARHRAPSVAQVLRLLLDAGVRRAQLRRHSADALRYLTRPTELWPDSPGVWPPLITHHLSGQAWRECEQAARRGLSARPEDPFLHRSLAVALVKQNQSAEAAEVLQRLLARVDDPQARVLLAQLSRELDASRDMAQRGSSHFRLQFEGDRDDAIGGAVLQTLEDKYGMLARALGCEPTAEVPVVLYPRQKFLDLSGAPSWAGASFSHFDGRIRIGTRDLSAGFVPLDLERTLTHELTHAFVAACSGGRVPSDVNEGLAQYLSGRRLGYRFDPARAGKGGRVKVADFYDGALSFVEYLLDRHRQSSMNDLLKYMGEMDTEAAFNRAYGQGYGETRAEWLKQLQ
jgi:hypothetical protein